jgi:hypothetical protein
MLFWIVPTTGGPSLADWMTAWGTLATAVGALVAVWVTVHLAAKDRRVSEKARTEDLERYKQGLAEERDRSARDRADAERRLTEERVYAEELRRRDRREASVGGLLSRIAGLMPFFDVVPGLNLAADLASLPDPLGFPGGRSSARAPKLLEAREAVRWLSHGGHAEVWGLGDARAASQYRKLVHLVDTAVGENLPDDLYERAGRDLRRYGLWVRISLESLIETGQSLDPGIHAWPDLMRIPLDDAPWQPSNVAEAWRPAILQEPGDMAYLPAHLWPGPVPSARSKRFRCLSFPWCGRGRSVRRGVVYAVRRAGGLPPLACSFRAGRPIGETSVVV